MIREDIASGTLKPNDPLLSMRKLAAKVGVNRNTVASAYAKLVREGLIESRGRGMRVANRPFIDTSTVPNSESHDDVVNLADGNPDPAFLPSLVSVSNSVLSQPPVLYGCEPDYPELLDEFRNLSIEDGLPVDGVMIMPGTTEGIGRVLTEYVGAGNEVIVEDPCYMKVLYLLRSMGITPVPVPMDAEGMSAEVLEGKIKRRTKAIILTPRAQNPTGISYSKARIEQIREVLSAYPELLVLEDEHLGPLSAEPYYSAVSPDRKHWGIFRSVAKYLGPDFRISGMLASEETTWRMKARRAATGHWVSFMLQRLSLAVWQDQKSRSLIAKARSAYKLRRDSFLAGLAEKGIHAIGDDGLFVWLPTDDSERIAGRLYRAGWSVRTGSDFCIEAKHGLRITTAYLSAKESEALVDLLGTLLSDRNIARAHFHEFAAT